MYYRLEWLVKKIISIITRIFYILFFKQVKRLKFHAQRRQCFCCTGSLICINVHLSSYNFCIQCQWSFVAYNLAVVYDCGKCIISITLFPLSHINSFWICCTLFFVNVWNIFFDWLIDWLIDWFIDYDLLPWQMTETDSYCWVCHRDSRVICCELCPRVYHIKCLGIEAEPPGEWVCPECQVCVSSSVNWLHPVLDIPRVRKEGTCFVWQKYVNIIHGKKFWLKTATAHPVPAPTTKQHHVPSVLARIEKFSNLPVINFFLQLSKQKTSYFCGVSGPTKCERKHAN